MPSLIYILSESEIKQGTEKLNFIAVLISIYLFICLFIYSFIYLLYLIIVPSLSIKDRAYLQITIVLPHQGKTKEKSRYSNVTSSSFTYEMLFRHML